MNYDFDKSLDVYHLDMDPPSDKQKQEWLRGFEFVYQRIKDILQYESRFDPEDIKDIIMKDDHIHVQWTWTEYGRCGDQEQHDEFRKIPFEAIFSETAEEAERKRAADERQQALEEQRRREEETRRRQAEQAARAAEVKERAEYARLQKKYGNQ